MGRAFALVLVAWVAGCYQSPSLASCKYRCGGANNNSCPSGFECNAGMCVAPGDQCDGDGGVIDGPDDGGTDSLIDMSTIDAPMCANPDVNAWLPKPVLMTGAGLRQIVVLDANNDNMVDIVALDASDAIGFYAGAGDGTFGARQGTTTALAGSSSKKLVTGDFDRDGQRDDLLVLQTGGELALAIMASLGNGLFTRTTAPLSGAMTDFGNAGDVDGNGREDVIVLFVNGGSSKLEVMLQTDTAPFWTTGTNVATNSNATSVFVGKVNGNNITDAIVTMTGTNQMGLHVGAGTTSAYALAAIQVANVPSAVQAVGGQLRAVGTPSIVSVSTSQNNVTIKHINGVAGTVDGGAFTVGSGPKAVILADVVGNALPEIITADSGSSQFSVLRNEGAGNFANPVAMQTESTPSDLVAADFDADGRLDIAVANVGSQTISIFLNKCEP